MHRLLQFTLDLFDSTPDQPPVAPAPRPKSPVGRMQTAQDAIENIADATPLVPAAPAEPFDQVMSPAAFRHPRASREARLGDTLVAYEFKRARRRTIGFVVGPDGLTVSAPKWVPLYEIDAAVREKSAWITRKLDEMRERRQKLDAARVEWKDGTVIPFLGESVIVVLDPRSGATVLNTDASALPGVPRLTLHIGLPHHATADQIRDTVQAWLMRQAKRVFGERLDHYAPLLGVRWKKLSLSSAGTRWGSASADGSIRLNWRLVHFRLPVIDYVVAHELSHLRVMDHSPRFWDTVATVVPDYAQLRGQLKDEALPQWD